MRVEEGFQLVPFAEAHPFTADPVLPSLLKRILPSNVLGEIKPDLLRFGNEINTSIRALCRLVEPPRLTQYNQWGQRVDELHTSEGWKALKQVVQKEGIPGIFYERKYGEHSRVYGFTKIFLMTGDSQEIFCPISMTDGSARVLELLGTPAMKQDVLSRLISRDPSIAFTSGQWMTERPGGSDISQTETTATLINSNNAFGPQYKIDGFKWFSSATDSQVAVALARTGSTSACSRALSLFLVPFRLPLLSGPSSSPISNGVLVHRLKNKIGTHALPTAELSLNASTAYLIGPLDEGVKSIVPVLNITRVYSAIASVGNLRKCLSTASEYARVRHIRGGTQLLCDTPLHNAQLATVSIVYRALTHLVFGAVGLMGKVECGVANAEEGHRLRMLTPVVKAFSAEKACTAMEEAMTALGGAGYMEENDFGRAIRDGLVEKIWEGTTAVLSLDLIRASRDSPTLEAFITWGEAILSSFPEGSIGYLEAVLMLREGLHTVQIALTHPIPPLLPRPALILTGHVASGLYLLEHAIWAQHSAEPSHDVDIEVFRRWIAEGGLTEAVNDVKRAKSDGVTRSTADSAIVYGSIRPKLPYCSSQPGDDQIKV